MEPHDIELGVKVGRIGNIAIVEARDTPRWRGSAKAVDVALRFSVRYRLICARRVDKDGDLGKVEASFGVGECDRLEDVVNGGRSKELLDCHISVIDKKVGAVVLFKDGIAALLFGVLDSRSARAIEMGGKVRLDGGEDVGVGGEDEELQASCSRGGGA